MTKPFVYEGRTQTRRQWAAEIDVELPTFAHRVRRYEAGEMTLAEVMTPGTLPRKIRGPSQKQRKRLKVALEQHAGNGEAVAEAWKVSRQYVHKLVHACGLAEFAAGLRKARAPTGGDG